MRPWVLAIVVGCSSGSPSSAGCCSAPSAPAPERVARLWDGDAQSVEVVEAVTPRERVRVTRDDVDPTRAWCRVATEVPGRAPRVLEFPVEGETARELFGELAGPEVVDEIGQVDAARRAALGLDGKSMVTVTIDGEPRRLEVASTTDSELDRAVLDPATGRAYVVADRWWRTLSAAPRLLPLRKLVERRGLERVTIHARGRAVSLTLRDEAWVPEDAAVDRARAEGVVLQALRLRPGTFDRELDVATLREVVRLEFEGGPRPQTLELFAQSEKAFWVRSTRAAGIARVHHLDAIALEQAVAALPRAPRPERGR